jgi:nitrogenase molybdenum-iron protein NifN
MDLFVETITKISGQPIPDALMLERGWLLDGMADSHKFNAEGRPVIYGEPELVYAFATLCAENGATPVVIASGTKNSLIAERLNQVIESADEKPVILEGADIAAIEESALCAGSNIAIGHSGGKSLTERHGISLVRIGFPIHDRTGGQRILSAGYRGTLAFLDRFTNTLLETKYATYRQKIKEELCTTRGS